jgi:hypothetical protein
MDKVTEILLDALKSAMNQPEAQRLFKSGKLPGLFAGKTSVNNEAAQRALREGLLEVVNTELKGKVPIEWVKITPAGIDLLLAHESPARALDELRAALQITQEGVPAWVTEIRRGLAELSERVSSEVEAIGRRLEALSQRAAEAIRRSQAVTPKLPDGAAGGLPWADNLFNYLERRRAGGVAEACPLPELFTQVRAHEPELTLRDFHSGLRRLYDRGVLRLLPFDGPGELPEPEYALLDGPEVIYFAAPVAKAS